LPRGDRVVLKMDLQGYELHAFARRVYASLSIEVILTGASFYSQAYEPAIIDLMTFLDAGGFQLYDIGTIAGRRRDNRANTVLQQRSGTGSTRIQTAPALVPNRCDVTSLIVLHAKHVLFCEGARAFRIVCRGANHPQHGHHSLM
jgi:hypothetical protein